MHAGERVQACRHAYGHVCVCGVPPAPHARWVAWLGVEGEPQAVLAAWGVDLAPGTACMQHLGSWTPAWGMQEYMAMPRSMHALLINACAHVCHAMPCHVMPSALQFVPQQQVMHACSACREEAHGRQTGTPPYLGHEAHLVPPMPRERVRVQHLSLAQVPHALLRAVVDQVG